MQIYKLTKKSTFCRGNIVYVCGQESQDSCGLKFGYHWHRTLVDIRQESQDSCGLKSKKAKVCPNCKVRSRKTPVD